MYLGRIERIIVEITEPQEEKAGSHSLASCSGSWKPVILLCCRTGAEGSVVKGFVGELDKCPWRLGAYVSIETGAASA